MSKLENLRGESGFIDKSRTPGHLDEAPDYGGPDESFLFDHTFVKKGEIASADNNSSGQSVDNSPSSSGKEK